MNEDQKINCSVQSCIYQDGRTRRCTLHTIHVMPTNECNTQDCDESMCGSYEYGE